MDIFIFIIFGLKLKADFNHINPCFPIFLLSFVSYFLLFSPLLLFQSWIFALCVMLWTVGAIPTLDKLFDKDKGKDKLIKDKLAVGLLIGGVVVGKTVLVGGAVLAKALLLKKLLKKKKKPFGGVFGDDVKKEADTGVVVPGAYPAPVAYQPTYYAPPAKAYPVAYPPVQTGYHNKYRSKQMYPSSSNKYPAYPYPGGYNNFFYSQYG